MAAVRIARKQAKRDANRQHVERAVRRATAAPVSDDEVVRAMVGLKDEQRARRQQQSDAAFGELEERRQRRWTETQNWNQGGGLPEREVMELDGEKYDVKWDICGRYSVAGTDWMEGGERVRGPAPVDYVEGVGAFLLT
ncbi:hypothetical protein PI126_g17816 [Phytophthora idaei]|nr:hypothetical protein PI126_g17816 [Phytophthora idaei]